MRKLLFASASVLALSAGGAFAADVYEGGSMKDPIPEPIISNGWGGFYLGGSAGVGVGTVEHETTTEVLAVAPGAPIDPILIDVDISLGLLTGLNLTGLLAIPTTVTGGVLNIVTGLISPIVTTINLGALTGPALSIVTGLGVGATPAGVVGSPAFALLSTTAQLDVLAQLGLTPAGAAALNASIQAQVAAQIAAANALALTTSVGIAGQATAIANLGGGVVLGTGGILNGLLNSLIGILGPILSGDGTPGNPGSLGSFASGSSETNMNGAVYGAHAGYNFAMPGGFVVGVEGQINGTDMSGEDFCGPTTCEHDMNYYATGELRLGYAMNDALFYIHGGYAYANMDSKWFGDDYEDERDGFVVGVGAEYKLTDSFSLRIAYSHIEFDEGDEQSASFVVPTSDGGAALIGVTDESELTLDTITVGASVHF